MNFDQALEYIYGAEVYGSVLGLDTMERILAKLGEPHKSMKFVHVAGTNGKGSVCSYVSMILRAAGYRTGLYVSPYVQDFGERIQCNGEYITNEELAEITETVKEKAEELVAEGFRHPTVFELMTAIAFVYYKRKECDIVVLEVGLGGRMDATNIIAAPEAAVIAHIGLDHTEQLGDTVEKIAFEKAGIIKEGCRTVVYAQKESVMDVFKKVCGEKHSAMTVADGSKAKLKSASLDGMTFDFEQYEGLHISLIGEHQIMNAATAIKTAEALCEAGWKINEKDIREGLENTRWIGRFEVLQRRSPVVIVDGAHNPQGVESLLRALKLLFGAEKKYIFVMGVLGDKDYKTSVKMAVSMGKSFYTARPPMPGRSLSSYDLACEIEKNDPTVKALPCDSMGEALDCAMAEAVGDDVVCIFGSLYQVGDVRRYFNAN